MLLDTKFFWFWWFTHFCRENLRTFSADVLDWKQNPQTFSFFGCMTKKIRWWICNINVEISFYWTFRTFDLPPIAYSRLTIFYSFPHNQSFSDLGEFWKVGRRHVPNLRADGQEDVDLRHLHHLPGEGPDQNVQDSRQGFSQLSSNSGGPLLAGGPQFIFMYLQTELLRSIQRHQRFLFECWSLQNCAWSYSLKNCFLLGFCFCRH